MEFKLLFGEREGQNQTAQNKQTDLYTILSATLLNILAKYYQIL